MKTIDLIRGCNPLIPNIPEEILKTPCFNYNQETDDELINLLKQRYDSSQAYLFNGSVQAIQYILMQNYDNVIMLKDDFYVTEKLAIENKHNITLIERSDLFLNLNLNTEEKTENKKLYIIPYSSGYDGFTFSLEKIEMLLKNLTLSSPNSLFVLDGAYAEYSKINVVYLKVLLKKYKNFSYMGTFSKAYSLAGYRVGYLVGNFLSNFNEQLIHFIIPAVSAKVALYLLKNDEFVKTSVEFNDQQKENLRKNNKHLITTESNRVNYHNPNLDNTQLHSYLLKNNITTRPIEFKGNKTISASIGTEEQNQYFLKILTQWEKESIQR
jgi:histidinol-phosphate aminotransferase